MKSPIETLVEDLVLHFREDAHGSRAASLLARYAREQTDWHRFARFDPEIYTRNLVARNAAFEMLVLCWSPGQESPIHDHSGQHCFMGVLEGEVEEIQFEQPERPGHGPLARLGSRVFQAGQVAYIHDRIALHRVRPHGGQRAASLHLYAGPIDSCQVYDEWSGAVLSRQLIYHSAAT